MNDCNFKPFDRVLVRDDKKSDWSCDLYSHYDESIKQHCCISSYYKYCIPYEGNEAFLGTTNEPRPERWRAEIGEYYYRIFISFDGVHIWESLEDGKKESDCYYQNNNYFRTKEEAQAMADRIKEMLKGE